MSATEFAKRYYSLPTYNKDSKNYDSFAYQCYDHIWVVAMALECADKRLKEQGQ